MILGYLLIFVFIIIGCVISSFFGVLPAMLFILVMVGISLLVKLE